MALKQMEGLRQQAGARFGVEGISIIHRLGRLEIGETSVLVVVASAHRAAAFDACRWIIDTLKKTVPIWKKEHFEDEPCGRMASRFPKKSDAHETQRGSTPHPTECLPNEKVLSRYATWPRDCGLRWLEVRCWRNKRRRPRSKSTFKLVNVFVTVTDGHGAPVGGLAKENFLIKEDGKEQKIAVFSRESERRSRSYSRRHQPQHAEGSALGIGFGEEIRPCDLRPQDGLAVYKFSEEVREVVPFTSDLKAIDSGIDRIRNGSATALYDAIFLGAQALNRRHEER